MSNLVIRKSQLNSASSVLGVLFRSVAPEFIGIISTSGQTVTVLSSQMKIDVDAMASLAASSFAATRQLAGSGDGAELTIMFQKGNGLNVHIAQISEKLLLAVCFSRKSELGKIRLISRKAAAIVSEFMKQRGEQNGAD